jgi:hypothetical protein
VVLHVDECAVALGVGAGVSASAADTPTPASTTPTASPTPGSSSSVDPNDKSLYPFGSPQGGPAVKAPPPPGEPTLAPAYTTKTTTRIYGSNPYEEAVSVAQHVWTSALPENVPANAANNADRTRAVTLVTTDDPLTAITATPLIHFPDAAPILYVTKDGIPDVTLNELKRLGPVGMARFNNVHAFLVGAAANPGVENQLKAIGTKFYAVAAGDHLRPAPDRSCSSRRTTAAAHLNRGRRRRIVLDRGESAPEPACGPRPRRTGDGADPPGYRRVVEGPDR